MRRLAPLLLLALVLSGCAGREPPAQDVTAGPGLVAERGEDGVMVRLGDTLQPHVVQACAGACRPLEVPRGTLVADAALLSLGNVSVNAAGPDRDSAVFFHDDGRETGRFLRWSDVQSRFQMNADLLATGNVTATGHVGTVTPLQLPDGRVVTVTTAAVEGVERAVFARGTGFLRNGTATVTFPDAFVALVGGPLTAQVTATSPGLGLYVEEKAEDHLVVRGEPGANGAFDWFVQAARKGGEGYSP
ncbi:MAG TPA: hypothetical protein VNX21_02230 [Candidatus Thermoplasmatota archaeon]|nr:hypothetical protein [Candidatus Thermoplasmatota archaeon]